MADFIGFQIGQVKLWHGHSVGIATIFEVPAADIEACDKCYPGRLIIVGSSNVTEAMKYDFSPTGLEFPAIETPAENVPNHLG